MNRRNLLRGLVALPAAASIVALTPCNSQNIVDKYPFKEVSTTFVANDYLAEIARQHTRALQESFHQTHMESFDRTWKQWSQGA